MRFYSYCIDFNAYVNFAEKPPKKLAQFFLFRKKRLSNPFLWKKFFCISNSYFMCRKTPPAFLCIFTKRFFAFLFCSHNFW